MNDILIKNEYVNDKLTIRKIALKHSVRPETISKILRAGGVKLRPSRGEHNIPYVVNHNYFSKIDSPVKAYLLGLLYADGHVALKNNTINLVSNDIELINLFKNEIGCNKEIYRNPNHKNAYTFYFCSSQMKSDLIKLGCVTQKSLILKFPSLEQVPLKYIKFFLLGNFDGDGSVTIDKTGKAGWAYFLGPLDFCLKIKSIFEKLEIKTNTIQKNGRIYRIRVTGIKNLRKFRDFIYDNEYSFGLKRKKEKFYGPIFI